MNCSVLHMKSRHESALSVLKLFNLIIHLQYQHNPWLSQKQTIQVVTYFELTEEKHFPNAIFQVARTLTRRKKKQTKYSGL